MIACKCPKCAKLFTVPESRRGDVIACPHCGRQLRLPAPGPKPTPQPAPAPAEGGRPRQPAAAPAARQSANLPDLDVGGPQPGSAEESSAPVFQVQDVPEVAPVDEPEPPPPQDVDDEEEPPRSRGPRRRRRRRRRKSGQMSRFALGLAVYLGGLGVAGFIALVMIGVSFLLPSVVLLVIGYGAVLTLVGLVWLYLLAHEDGWELISRPDFSGGPRLALGLFFGLWTTIALLVILVTAVLYGATNLERGWKPGVLTVLGVLTLAAGLFLLYHIPGA
jgi:hypothetical protein